MVRWTRTVGVGPLLPAALVLTAGLGVVLGQGAPAGLLPGTGTVTGTVKSASPIKAAQIHLLNTDRNVLYAVYTKQGRFRAPNLLPGRYEIRVNARGWSSPTVAATVTTGTEQAVTLDASAAAKKPTSGSFGAPMSADAELVPYEQLYPPEPARALVEKHCMVCHGRNFLPTKQFPAEAWDGAVDMMMNPDAAQGAQIPPGTLTPDARRQVVGYLAKHFGPDSRRRGLLVDAEFPVDEDVLSKAMYVEYRLPLDRSPKRRAQDPYFDGAGNVWYTDRGIPNFVGRLDPRTASFTDYALPNPKGDPHGLTVDRFGTVFWAETVGLHLGRLDPKTGRMDRFSMDPLGNTPGGQGHTPVLDSKDNVWFTVIIGNRIGKWDRRTEKITTWEVPTPNSYPYGIKMGKDDRVWFAEFHGCKVAVFDPKTEKFTEWKAKTQPCTIRRMSFDSKGTVWYGVFSDGKLGKVDPRSGEVGEYDIPMPFSEPYDVWPDPFDNIWVSDGGQGGALIRFDQKSQTFTYYPTPTVTDQPKLEITRNGAVWYCTRSAAVAAVGVLFPDVSKMEYGAYY